MKLLTRRHQGEDRYEITVELEEDDLLPTAGGQAVIEGMAVEVDAVRSAAVDGVTDGRTFIADVRTLHTRDQLPDVAGDGSTTV